MLSTYIEDIWGLTEFFPADIDKILTNKLSLGTWVACDQGGRDQFGKMVYFPRIGRC
ncbi:hypothetical protein HanIR_Chr11g0530851 [Helianthus annuus]|nr:hypothetical protein HanIR_Chr11g0530851 [Helianthus annuus]